MLRTGRAMVTSGTVMIVEPDPALAAIWAEVAVYAGFAAEVVPDLFEETPGGTVQALVVRVSPARHRLPAGDLLPAADLGCLLDAVAAHARVRLRPVAGVTATLAP